MATTMWPSCQQTNDAEAAFCRECGTRLENGAVATHPGAGGGLDYKWIGLGAPIIFGANIVLGFIVGRSRTCP